MKIADNQISVGADNVVRREIETAYFGRELMMYGQSL